MLTSSMDRAIDKLENDELQEVIARIVDRLPDSMVIVALDRSLTDDQKAALAQLWGDE